MKRPTHRARSARQNGRRGRGPRTAAGKARAATNTLRHGLSVPAAQCPGAWPAIGRLAGSIAGDDGGAARQARARMIAAAELDLLRVRSARAGLVARLATATERQALAGLVTGLERLDRYERRALSRRKFAIRAFDRATRREHEK